mgnify:CR=1 FL=1
MTDIIVSTTSRLEGRPAQDYLGIVTGEVIVGANLFRDLFASVRDIVRMGRYPHVDMPHPDEARNDRYLCLVRSSPSPVKRALRVNVKSPIA